jgi:hypothetical protein
VIRKLAVRLRTILLLGPINVANVALYKFSVADPFGSVRRLRADLPSGPFFKHTAPTLGRTPSTAWKDHGRYFGWFEGRWPDRHYPDWHSNPIEGSRVPDPTLPWWSIPDHDARVGDIKAVWEASRFDWVLAMAQRAAAGDPAECDRLNAWLDDWCLANPAYRGPNWKCGQETSIRVLHLAMASVIAGQSVGSPAPLLDLVEAHLKRVEPTLRFAMAQDNNHGASEAAALFVGGSWLARSGRHHATRWERRGRQKLEQWARRLIEADGTSGQYSMNYHRFVIDVLSMAEVWRRTLALEDFSSQFKERAKAAARWMATMVDPQSGDVFNIGANDGSRLLPLTDTDYRDYRPSVQLAMALFASARPYPAVGHWNEPLHWLKVPVPEIEDRPEPRGLFDNGGFALLRRGAAAALLRYPKFRFRPSQADALHLDLVVSGNNVIRDAGTFSYTHSTVAYFGGTEGHNTVQFDGRDQMPRLGRFLLGDWLRTHDVEAPTRTSDVDRCSASYRDRHGAFHKRSVALFDDRIRIEDAIHGFGSKAVLRWRLAPGAWRVVGNSVTNGDHALTLTSTMPIVRFEMTEGWESRYYLQKTPVPVLEVEVHQPGTLATDYRWQT